MGTWVCSGDHRAGWRLLCCRRTSLSSNVNLWEMLSWYRPPSHKCSDTSSRCFTQLLLSHDNTPVSGSNKQTRVTIYQDTQGDLRESSSSRDAPCGCGWHSSTSCCSSAPESPSPSSCWWPPSVVPSAAFLWDHRSDKWAQNGWNGLLSNITSWISTTFLPGLSHNSRTTWILWKTCWNVTFHVMFFRTQRLQ